MQSEALLNDLRLWGRRTYWKWNLTFPYLLPSLCSANPVGPLIGKYCGTKTPSELRSSTGILSLTFHTDMAVAKDGFSARYYLVHQEPLESELASWEPLSCPFLSGGMACWPLQDQGPGGHSAELALASEFREWELCPLVRQRWMKTEQMSIWVLIFLKETNSMCTKN